jgi:hypothetical protein
VKVAFSSAIIHVWALVAVRAAKVGCNPIGGINVLDRKALVYNETDVAV